MQNIVRAIIAELPLPEPMPLPESEERRLYQLQEEASGLNDALAGLMSHLYQLDLRERRRGNYNSPTWDLWTRCAKVQARSSTRWSRRARAWRQAAEAT